MKHTSTRRRALRQLASMTLATVACVSGALAQGGYPDRPVTFIVPFATGGGTDATARLLAARLGAKWGQSIVVDNRGGAAGIVGSDVVARARPDGYTLLIANVGTLAINPALYAKLPYDNATAFTPIAMVAELPIVLVTHPRFAAKSIPELVAMAKDKPEKISYASSGAGNSTHLAGEFFQAAAGVKLLHVPYKGGGPATMDLLAGNVDLQFTAVLGTVASINAGQVRALAVTSAQRTPALPNVPTLAELGVPGAESGSWIALMGPQGLPQDLVAKIAADVNAVMGTAEMKQSLGEQGASYSAAGPEALKKIIADNTRRYGQVIRKLGITASN